MSSGFSRATYGRIDPMIKLFGLTLSKFGRARSVLTDSTRELLRHEWRAVTGHFHALVTRLAVARQARSPVEMLRDQIDLIPESRLRLRRDQQTRIRILLSFGAGLREAATQDALKS
jgi:hypothetical protein